MLMMALSRGCAVLVGLLFGASPWLVLLVGRVWGFAVVADSAQFSTMVTELADQSDEDKFKHNRAFIGAMP